MKLFVEHKHYGIPMFQQIKWEINTSQPAWLNHLKLAKIHAHSKLHSIRYNDSIWKENTAKNQKQKKLCKTFIIYYYLLKTFLTFEQEEQNIT